MMTQDERLMTRFNQDMPNPPDGFSQRHDALLHRLTTGREEPYMRKQRMMRTALVMVLVLAVAGVALAAAQQFGLVDLMRLYGHNPEQLAAPWHEPYAPTTYEQQGRVKVTVQELLSDGYSWYASFAFESLNPQHVLMPNFAERGDAVVGVVPGSQDAAQPSPSFEQLAQQQGGTLLLVGAYVELPGEEVGFSEWFGTPEGGLTIVAGGYGDLPTQSHEATLRILTEEMDQVGNLIPDKRMDTTYAITVPTYGEKQVRTYKAPAKELPQVKEVILTQTALTTYMEVKHVENSAGSYEYALVDAQGQPLPKGFTLTGQAYKLDGLPETLQLEATDYAHNEQKTLVTLQRQP